MTKKTYTAEITDPVTGQVSTLSAETEEDLEQQIEKHLADDYPD